jgi:hypothetical protein
MANCIDCMNLRIRRVINFDDIAMNFSSNTVVNRMFAKHGPVYVVWCGKGLLFSEFYAFHKRTTCILRERFKRYGKSACEMFVEDEPVEDIQ